MGGIPNEDSFGPLNGQYQDVLDRIQLYLKANKKNSTAAAALRALAELKYLCITYVEVLPLGTLQEPNIPYKPTMK